MLKSPSRNQRSKGFKVKHALHICLLLAFGVWLLYQVKQTYKTKEVLDKVSSKVENSNTGSQYSILKLGRKGLDPQTKEIAREFKIREDEDDVFEIEDEEKLQASLGELRGAGDDEIDVHDLEKAEDDDEPDQLDDLIDEGDKEKEEEDEGKGNVETDGFAQDVNFEGILKNSEEAKEERYKGESIQVKNKLDGVDNSRT